MNYETHESGSSVLLAPRRNRYYYGKLLDEFHLRMEQEYHNNKRWLLNRLSLGRGVLCGLELTEKGGRIHVSPGVALDAWGREIIVPKEASLDPWLLSGESDEPGGRLGPEEDHTAFICVAYRECLTDFSPVLVTDCDAQDCGAPGTILEGYTFSITKTVPPEWPNTPKEELCKAISASELKDKLKNLCEVMSQQSCGGSDKPPCVVLGQIELKKKTDTEAASSSVLDDCTHRRRAYSNETLFEMIMCQASGGSRGPEGPPGQRGEDGQDGKDGLKGEDGQDGKDGLQGEQGQPGPGLEEGLTRIVALSWEQGAIYGGSTQPFLVNVTLRPPAGSSVAPSVLRGLVIGFDAKVRPPFPEFPRANIQMFLDRMLALEVLALNVNVSGGALNLSWDPILGFPAVVTGFTTSQSNDKLIIEAEIQQEPGPTEPREGKGIAFITGPQLIRGPSPALVRLRGDFFVDLDLVDPAKPGRAIDAEFVRGELPTGDRPRGNKFGVQGGTFESWFYPQPQDFVPPVRGRAGVSLNTASFAELAFVPGIGFENAIAITAAREENPDRFKKVDDLIGIGTIDKDALKEIRRRVQS